MKPSKLNILWISDIHYQENYSEINISKDLISYNEGAINIIKRNHTAETPIKYILLSGDLAMKGTEKDYDCFNNHFLTPLLNSFILLRDSNELPLPKVLVIPGNHDVNWRNSNFLKEYLNALDPSTGSFIDRETYLKRNEVEFNKLFCEYSNFIIKLHQNDTYKEFFDFDDDASIIIYSDYKTKRLFGYLIDKKNRLFFNLINSSWYSIGENFNNLMIASEFLEAEFSEASKEYSAWYNNIDEKDLQDKILKLKEIINKSGFNPINQIPKELKKIYEFFVAFLKKKDWIVEYGKQVSGMNLWKREQKSILDFLSMYNDYVVITCMHHPLNWLDWNEQYNSAAEKGSSPDILNHILDSTDLLLTGHEHIPIRFSDFIESKNYFHLRAGCFLNDNQNKKLKIKDNWFSLLTIDAISRRAIHRKIEFKGDLESGNWSKNDLSGKNIADFKRTNFYLTEERKQDILKLISNTDELKITNYLHSTNPIGYESDAPIKKIEELSTINYLAFYQENSIGNYLIFFALTTDFYPSLTTKEFYEKLDTWINSITQGPKYIKFLVVDILINDDEEKSYSRKDLNREEIRVRKFKYADLMFDKLRMDYFMRFESSEELSKKLPRFVNISFLNQPITYWEFESEFC